MELSLTQIRDFKIIKVAGKADWEHAQELDNKVREVIGDGFARIVFNLDDVEFLCSGAIGALVYNLDAVKKKNGAIYIISSNEYVNYILGTLKFDIVFDGLLFKSFEEFQARVLDTLPETQ